MKIAIRKEPNGSIYIDKNLRSDINYTESPYNFKLIEIPDTYKDCENHDFNDDLSFDINKYNVRKETQNNLQRIEELKQSLSKYDYIGVKIATGCATIEEYSKEIEQCKAWREEINKLESEINGII